MRVMLLSLPGFEEGDGNLFPLGIGYLAAELQKENEVQARHYRFMAQARVEVPQLVRSFEPEVVGLTCSTFNRGPVREMIGLIRKLEPRVQIVVGGVHASFCYEQILKRYGADVVVIGEGERTFAELCSAIAKRAPLTEVLGIARLDGAEVVLNPPRPVIRDLDDLVLPDYSYARPFMERSGMGFLITSRGCPVRCTFCSTSSFWGQQVRMHTPSRVVDEMEMLVSRFKVKKIFFHDDTFNLGVARVKAICSEITKRGLQVEWGCSCRVTPVTQDMIATMVAAGCRHICWGIESGSAAMLSRISKKISLEQIRTAYEFSARFSDVMSTGAFTMVGNPGETEATVQETVSFLNSIPITDAPSTSILYILPGTVLYEDLKGQGKIADSDWHRHDAVPNYPVENSYRRLSGWAALVRNSGARLPFDAEKHFWNEAPEISQQKSALPVGSRIARKARALLDPAKWRSVLVRALPAGRIRF